MKRSILLFVCAFVLFSCGEPVAEPVAMVGSEEIPLSYAKGFSIRAQSNGFFVELYNLENEEQEVMRTILIQNADTTSTEADLHLAHAAENVACLSTTHIALMQASNSIDHLVATAFAEYVKNPQAKQLIEAGKVQNLSGSEEIEFELLLDIDPDIFLVYPFGQTDYTNYEQHDIPCIPISEYLEEHPLGRAEWVKLIGLLTGHFNEAVDAFAQMEKEYLKAQQLLSNIDKNALPTVFTGSHSNGQWFAPPGTSFIGQFIADAGGDYLFSDYQQKGNVELQFEELFDLAYEVDYWGKVVFEEGDLTLEMIRNNDERYAELSAFKEGNVFYCNASETDYFGDAIVEPHKILTDLVAILHPTLLPDHDFSYFQRVKN